MGDPPPFTYGVYDDELYNVNQVSERRQAQFQGAEGSLRPTFGPQVTVDDNNNQKKPRPRVPTYNQPAHRTYQSPVFLGISEEQAVRQVPPMLPPQPQGLLQPVSGGNSPYFGTGEGWRQPFQSMWQQNTGEQRRVPHYPVPSMTGPGSILPYTSYSPNMRSPAVGEYWQGPPSNMRYVQYPYAPSTGSWDTDPLGPGIPVSNPLLPQPQLQRVPPSRRPGHGAKVGKGHRRAKSSRSGRGSSSGRRMLESVGAAFSAPTYVPGGIDNGPLPSASEAPLGGFYWGLFMDSDDLTLPVQMYEPPLHDCIPTYPQALDADQQPRARKKSKYTQEQDQLILKLKNRGEGWAEIARKARCDNNLAARNRYQVLIGQQGGGAFVWTAEDVQGLQTLLDEGERAKWHFLATELSKKQNKLFSMEMCHYKMCEIFAENPGRFGVVKSLDPNRGGASYKHKSRQQDS